MAKVYLFNDDGYFVGVGESIPHPFNIGEESIPNNSTYLEVPEEKEGNLIRHYAEAGDLPERWSYEKVLTEAEQKIAGEISLVDGEYVENGELITVEATSILHTWNSEKHEWIVDPEKVQRMKTAHYVELSNIRELTLETGYYFEEGKLIKGRDRDLVRTNAVYTMFKDNLLSEVHNIGGDIGVNWTFSNNIEEMVTSLDRMKKIFIAVSAFVSSICNLDGALKKEVYYLTKWEDVLTYSPKITWNTKYNEILTLLVPPVVTEEEPTV